MLSRTNLLILVPILTDAAMGAGLLLRWATETARRLCIDGSSFESSINFQFGCGSSCAKAARGGSGP